MLESLAASLINQLLGEYISNLETKQLSLGIWNGDVVLHNLRLKKDALAKLKLPVDILEGFLGELTLQIPWSDLKNKPLKVFIKNLYILTVPKSSAEYDPIEEDDNAYERKLAKLAAAEEWANKKGQNDAASASFFSQLMTKIVDNVQVTIQNIHIRYEDLDTIPGNLFSIGFTLTELIAVSTDADGNEGFNQGNSDFIFKKLSLKNLGIYCSTGSQFFKFKSTEEILSLFAAGVPVDTNDNPNQYIVGPVSGSGRLVQSKKIDPDTPKINLSLVFDDLTFTLDDYQYTIFVRVLAAFARYNKSLPYRHLRPPLAITPKLDPRAWLQYAIKSVMKDITEKNHVWSWSFLQERRDRRITYISLYTKLKSQSLTNEEKSRLEDLERVLAFDDIRLYRHLAKSKMKKSVSPTDATSTPSSTWTSWLLGSSASSPISSTGSTSMSDIDVKQLYDTIEFDPQLAELEADLPQTAVRLDISAELKSGSLKLRTHNQGSPQDLVDFAEVIFDKFSGNFRHFTKAFQSSWSVDDLFVKDYSFSPCVNIVRGKPRVFDEHGYRPPLFYAAYEHLPFDNRAEDALSLSMLPLEIVINPKTINQISMFLTPHTDEQEGMLTIQSAARGAIRQMTAQTKAGLSYAIAEHKVFDLRVHIDAPLFILPSDCDNLSCPALFLDAGRFRLQSILVDAAKKKKIQDPQVADSFKIQDLESFLYDQLQISLSGLQMLVGPWDKISNSIQNDTSLPWHILENVNLSLVFSTSILPRAVEYPKYKVKGELPRLHLNFSDYKYKTALAIVRNTLSILFPSITSPVSNSPAVVSNTPLELSRDNSDQDFFVDALEDMTASETSLLPKVTSDDQIEIDFDFSVGELSLSFARQEQESVKTVVFFTMKALSFAMLQRRWDQEGKVTLQSIVMLDGHESASRDYLHLIDSSSPDASEVAKVSYSFFDKKSPRYSGLDFNVGVSLGSIKFNLVLQSILDAYDLIISTCFTPSEIYVAGPEPMDLENHSDAGVSPKVGNAPDQHQLNSNGNIQFKFRKLEICLVENDKCLGTGHSENFSFDMNINCAKLGLKGSLGRIGVINNIVDFPHEPERFLHVQDHQSASFTFTTLENDAFDSHFSLNASSWKITYNQAFLGRIYGFIEKFMQMQALLDSARRAASTSARRLKQGAGRFQLEVHMLSPIIEVPRVQSWPCDLLILNLGEIFVDNFKQHDLPNEAFLPVSQRFFVELKNMMASSFLLQSNGRSPEPHQVVSGVNITIVNDSLPSNDFCLPSSMVRVYCSGISGKLTDVQYRQIYDVWRLLSTSKELAKQPSTVSKRAEKRPETEYFLSFPEISIETFDTAGGTGLPRPLASLTGHSSSLKFTGFNDQSFELEIRLSAFSVHDTRDAKSVFREMMIPSSETDDQFILHCTGDPSGATYSLVIDRPKLVFDLEHLLAIRRFWLITSPGPSEDISSRTTLSPASFFSMRITFIESEITLIRDPQKKDSSGVILKMSNFAILFDQSTFISCQGVGMFLCQLDKAETTNIRVLDDADLTLSMDTRSVTPGQAYTNITISTTVLLVRMSYRDILLCQTILKQILSIVNTPSDSTFSTVHDNHTLAPVAVTSKEKLQVKLDGFRFVLIDDVDDLYLPMFDFNIEKTMFEMLDWASSAQVSTSVSSQLNYFNIKNSNWEPFMEKWSFSISAKKPNVNDPFTYDLFSKSKLDLNLSPVIMDTLSRASKALFKDTATDNIRSESRSPYVIRNRTGYRVQIWTETSSGAIPMICTVENNSDLNWSFDDWKTMREKTSLIPSKLSIQLEGPPWDAVKGVQVDQEGSKLYVLRPPLNRVIHKLDCHISLEKKVKIVTLQSTYVLNNDTNVPLEIRAYNREKKSNTFVDKIESRMSYAVPIESAYYDAIYVRPLGFGYNWNTEGLHWRDIDRVRDDSIVLTCHSLESSCPPFRLQVEALHSNSVERILYPHLNLRIVPPLTLENLLPFSFRYVIREQQSRQETRGELKPGVMEHLHTIDLSRTVGLKIEIVGQDFKQKEFALIVANEDYQDHAIRFADKSGRQLELKLHYGGPRKRSISIFSPYVIYNKTGMDLTVNSRSYSVTSRVSQDQKIYEPLLFSFTGFDSIQNRAQVKIVNSEWSNNISLEAVGTSSALTIPTVNKCCVHLGMHIQEGPDKYFMSKIITFQPRFIFKNSLTHDVHCQAIGNSSSFVVKCGENYPFLMLPPEGQFNGCIQIRLSDLMAEWSSEFSIVQIGSIYVKLKSTSEDRGEHLIRVDVMLEKATVFIGFSSQDSGRWPIRIENQTDTDLWCWQQKSNSKYRILRNQTLNYAWDFPSLDHKALVIHANGRERLVDVSQFGSLSPFKYPISGSSRHQVMVIDIVAEGPIVVVKLTCGAKSRYRSTNITDSETNSSAVSSALSEKSEPTEPVALSRILIRLEGIGISLISHQVQEIAYATLKSLTLVYHDTNVDEAVSVSIGWLQVDNQTYGATFPLIAYPTVVPKEDSLDEPHPVIMASVCRSKDTSYGVEYYKWFTILFQELSVEFDEDFLYRISEFLKSEVDEADDKSPPLTLVDWNSNVISFPLAYEDGNRLYFEKILLHPIQVNLSFSRSNSTTNDSGTRSSGVVGLVYDVLTMTIGNIHDAPIKLNALELEHPSLSSSQLVDLVMRFYTQEGVGQIHKILGAADFLGNPVGLFNNVASGVSDMFYEPFQGFEITKPQEFGLGVAKGASSLVKKTVFGVSDTLSKFTGSIGKGLSVMTLDEKFQEKRRLASRNRPKHVVYGVTNGAASLIRSVTSGVTGVVSQPLRGAQESGVEGFFRGLGKGLVGVVTKPIVGVVDLATNVSEGIKNTTTVFDAELDRQRLPRYVGRSKVLKSYSKREALGLNFLRTVENGRYFKDFYICHLEIRIEDLVCLVTENRVMMARMKRLRIEWDIQYSDVQLIRAETSGSVGIVPKQHRPSSGVLLIPVPDENSGAWLRAHIEEAFSTYLATHNPTMD